MSYTLLKTLHILSMVLLFGTGLGSAFYKWMADRSGNVAHIAVTNRHVVLADWIFTTPTVIFQPLSGFWMVYLLGLPWSTPWVLASFFFMPWPVFAGCPWCGCKFACKKSPKTLSPMLPPYLKFTGTWRAGGSGWAFPPLPPWCWW